MRIQFLRGFRLIMKKLLKFTQLLRPRRPPRNSLISIMRPWRLTSIVPLLVEIGHWGSSGIHLSLTHMIMMTIITTHRTSTWTSTWTSRASMTQPNTFVWWLSVVLTAHILAIDISRSSVKRLLLYHVFLGPKLKLEKQRSREFMQDSRDKKNEGGSFSIFTYLHA